MKKLLAVFSLALLVSPIFSVRKSIVGDELKKIINEINSHHIQQDAASRLRLRRIIQAQTLKRTKHESDESSDEDPVLGVEDLPRIYLTTHGMLRKALYQLVILQYWEKQVPFSTDKFHEAYLLTLDARRNAHIAKKLIRPEIYQEILALVEKQFGKVHLTEPRYFLS